VGHNVRERKEDGAEGLPRRTLAPQGV
jgi:hypothetical protein